ncbi:BF3164 family lipoprotein [uncultured Bacteroides sp.]|uniref:BF3164 family lipoprotein n=1 Tax=uncultured Bacteroides sp. TaxID=162156 RepID=UPI0025E849BF|nr:BF3164 family lipoprotein [uncultured Bacteroides sp.]
MKKIFNALLMVICWGCAHNSKTEVYQNIRANILDVQDKVKEIVINDVFIGPISPLCIVGDYLIIGDVKSQDNLIHIFDKNDFSYMTSELRRGEGPDEITNMGYIGTNEISHIFCISDHGKQKIFAYNIDSILSDSLYKPTVKARMAERLFPNKYKYINDSICLALIIKPTGNSGYNENITKWNMKTGEMNNMPYEHPDIRKKRVDFDLSIKNGCYVECYSYHDLMTICDLNGNLRCNIYGPEWDAKSTNRVSFYGGVVCCKDKIVALYSGKETFYNSGSGRIKVEYPTKFLVFDMNGNYIQTMETKYPILNFCYDEKNNRIIMSLDDDMQFAYLDLDSVI